MGQEETFAGLRERDGLKPVSRPARGSARARISTQMGEGFALAYADNLSHRLPLQYAVVLFDIFILMTSFWGTAPVLLTLWLPLPLLGLVCWRGVYWLPKNVQRRSIAALTRDIRNLPVVGTIVSLLSVCWALALYRYGSEAQQSVVHYMTAITCFTGILSLAQSPRAAIWMAAVVMIPSNLFFLMQDHPNRFAVVAVQIVVTFLLILVTASNHEDFVSHELSRQELSRRRLESEQLAEANRLSAIRDPLTGASNRRSILWLIEQALNEPGMPGPWLALVDLDGFKHINDTHGHASGDAVLCAVSERIGDIPEIEAFGRMGGDEFALLLPASLKYLQVLSALERLSAALRLPVEVHDLRLAIRGSIGLHRCRGKDIGECLERADAALYKAKEEQNGGVSKFTGSDERALRDRRAMTRVFTSADLGRQLALVYQPIVDSDTSLPVAFEALARWSPDGTSLLPPAAFITLAETTGRIGELTEQVLHKALDECRAWQWGCRLAVNLSARDILREDAATRIGGIVTEAAAPPSGIILEVTETALLTDYRRAADNLQKLRSMGFRIALDDFGTGQSSLSHVHNLPLDHIKIDQGFARDLVGSDRARAIVRTVLALARQLRLECTIEGIETPEQQAIARALGVRMMQGYYFGYPMTADKAFGGASAQLLAGSV